MAKVHKGRDISPKTLEFLKTVGVYPKWTPSKTNKLPADIPLAEEHGKICFPTPEDRDRFFREVEEGC